MFLTEQQAEVRLNSEKNLALRFGKNDSEGGRSDSQSVVPDAQVSDTQVNITEKVISLPGKNRINLTKTERTDIAINTRTGVLSQIDQARAANINVLTVNNIHKGRTKGIDEDRVKEITNAIKDRALERLMSSLGLLTDDKLSACSAKDLSTIASNMGRVVEKIQEKVEAPDNINFIIYTPELKQERAFDTIEV